MKKEFIVFFGAIVFFSCQRSDPDPGNTFFTLTNADEKIPLIYSWIFATDKLGKVLDVQPFTGTIYLRSTSQVPDSINITLLVSYIDGSCRLTTYAGIPKNSTLQFTGFEVPTELQMGKATITINDYPENSNNGNQLTFSDGYFSLMGKYASDSHSDSETWSLIQGFDSILVSGYNDLTPVYRWFPKVVDGNQINESFSTFSDYPKTMTIDFDGIISGYVSGLTSDNPFQGGFYFGNLFAFKSPATIGYLEGYSRYTTYLSSIATNGERVVYEKTGAVNPHVTLPSFDFKVIDNSLNNFKFSFSGDYTYYCVTWNNGTQTPSATWQVYTAKTSIPPMINVPALVSSRFPLLRLESLQYAGVDFIKLLDGSTFNDFAKNSLTRAQLPHERLTFSYY